MKQQLRQCAQVANELADSIENVGLAQVVSLQAYAETHPMDRAASRCADYLAALKVSLAELASTIEQIAETENE